MWHYGWHPFLWVWVPVRESLCLFWCETHTKSLRARTPTRPEEDEGKKVPETVDWRGQSREEGRSQQKGAGGDQLTKQISQGMRVGQRGDQSTEVRKAAARTCWPTDTGFTNARIWVSIPSGFEEVSLKYTPVIAWKCTGSSTKVSKTSLLLWLEVTQSCDCLFFFSFIPSVGYFVCW